MRRGLGQFQPHNGLSGRRENAAFKPPTVINPIAAAAASSSPAQPPPKRRRTDEVPSTSSPLSSLSRDGRHRQTPDQDRSQRHGSVSSFMTGDEPQIVVSSARRRGRRRRVTYSINERPKHLTSPSITDAESNGGYVDSDDSDIEIQGDDTLREVPRPKTTKPTTKPTPTKHNTELSIVLDPGIPKRQTLRSRMQSDVQPSIPMKRPIYDTRRFSESADELSEDHYHQRPKKTARPETTRGPGSGPMSTSVTTLVESPVRVAAAFRLPLYTYQRSNAGFLMMTINPGDPDTLTPVDEGDRVRLPWLRVPLDRARVIQYNMDSCSLCLEFPQDTKYNAAMGIRFSSTSDLRRVITWVLESPLLKTIRLQDIDISHVNKRFERGLLSAQEHKESTEVQVKIDATFDDSVDMDSDIKSSPLYKSGRPPASASASKSTAPPLPPRKDALKALASLRRTRHSINLGEPPEHVSLDTDRKKREPASSPKCGKSPGAETPANDDSRLSRLRNRNSRASLRFADDIPVERWTKQNPDWAANWRVPLSYARTTVDRDDVARLDEGEFLNDNIINFYIQYLQGTLKKSESSVAKRVYFHNTFFYEKLRPSRGNAISFEGVKRWTAKVDLFAYDYIVVPVNENAHWWVAIICNVPKILAAALPKEVPDSKSDSKSDKKAESDKTDGKLDDKSISVDDTADKNDDGVKFVSASASPSANKANTAKGKSIVKSIEVDDDAKAAPKASASPNSKDTPTEINDASDVDRSKDDDEVTEIKRNAVPQNSSPASAKKPAVRAAGRTSKKVFIPNGKKADPTDPRIFTLDSLGSVHTASVDHLKQWLMAEIAERKGVKPLDPGRLGTTAKEIPEQENFCDCGLYLLLYIREFTSDPDGFIEDIVLRRQRIWDTSAPDMRKQLRELILHMQKEYQDAEEAAKRLKKQQHQKRAAAAASPTLPRMKTKPEGKDKDDAEMAEIQDTSSVVRSSSPIIEAEQPPREMSGPPPALVASDLTFDPPSGTTSDNTKDVSVTAKKDSESEESVLSTAEVEAGTSSPFKENSPQAFMRST